MGGLNRTTDANITAQLLAGYPLRANLDVVAIGGFHQLTAEPGGFSHPHWLSGSVNARLYASLFAGRRLFLQAGPGYYRGKTGVAASSWGMNAGFGLLVPVTPSVDLELGLDFHYLGKGDRRFATVTLGFRF